MQWAEKGQEGRGTKDFKAHSGPASHSYRKNKGQMQTESLLGGEGSLGDAKCSACCPRWSCPLRITLPGHPHPLCLAYEALSQCLLKTIAVAEPVLTSVESPGKDLVLHVITEQLQWSPEEGEGTEGHTLLSCAAEEPSLSTQRSKLLSGWREAAAAPTHTPPRLPWGSRPGSVPLWLGFRWMITQHLTLAEKWSCDPTQANENQPWDFL